MAKNKKNKGTWGIENAGGVVVANAPTPTPPKSIAAPTPIDPQVEQFAKLTKLYGRTFNTPANNLERIMRRSGDPGEIATAYRQLGRLNRRENNAMPTLRSLSNFAQSQGFDQADTQNALQAYLKQENALAQFMPRRYRAPNKADLLNAVQTVAPKYQQERESQQQIENLIPYVAMIRDSMLATADSDYQYMMDKASTVKDPEKQAQAMATAENIYRLKLLQADSIAANPTGNAPNSIMSLLGAYNSGQTKNINNLYGGAGNTPESQQGSNASNAIDENFIAQVLGQQ